MEIGPSIKSITPTLQHSNTPGPCSVFYQLEFSMLSRYFCLS